MRRRIEEPFESEAEMIECWLKTLSESRGSGKDWTVYPETEGWDLLLVHKDGYQVGLEAKLSLNAHVVEQALKDHNSRWCTSGPDYRGVIVPSNKIQHHLEVICEALGIGICRARRRERSTYYHLDLPNEDERWSNHGWHSWLPQERCAVPDYVPDVSAGHKSPIQLTSWKIKAIKLMIILERRGHVTRADMKALQISSSRWTDKYHGFLSADKARGGYVRHEGTPDLRAQHPVNYAEIEADIAKWCPPGYKFDGSIKL